MTKYINYLILLCVFLVFNFNVFAQIVFSIEPKVYAKYGLSSLSPFQIESNVFNIEDFTFEHTSLGTKNPFNLGLDLNASFKRVSLDVGWMYDNVFSISNFQFHSLDELESINIKLVEKVKQRNIHLAINYQFGDDKTAKNLAAKLVFFIDFKGNSNSYLTNVSTEEVNFNDGSSFKLEVVNLNTEVRCVPSFGLGLEYKIHLTKRYLFDVELFGKYLKGQALYLSKYFVDVYNDTGYFQRYFFNNYKFSGGLYLSISREFQIKRR